MSGDSKIGSIMMIDDNEVDQMMTRRLINRTGMVEEFKEFLSAEDALAYLKTSDLPAVDAILLDINMPRMDGFEFLEAATNELGDSFARVVVVMLTTSLNPRDEVRALQYSVVKDYWNKPLDVEGLEKLAALLSSDQTNASGLD